MDGLHVFFMVLVKSTYAVILVSMIATATADEKLISIDGREILLSEDGRWVYISDDRLVTAADGRQVRLKANGSWEYTGDVRSYQPEEAADRKFVGDRLLSISLVDIVIESVRGKKSESHKNSRKKTRSVFHLNFSLDREAETSVTLPMALGDFSVSDTDGREYTVAKVTAETTSVSAGEEAFVSVIVDGSPHWWTTKSMILTIKKKALGSGRRIVLTRAMSTAKKTNVGSF